MRMHKAKVGVVVAAVSALVWPLVTTAGIPQSGFDTGTRKNGGPVAAYKRTATDSRAGSTRTKQLGGETLVGQLEGSWDAVTGVIAFPYQSEGGLDLFQVALTLPAASVGEDQYAASGWHREAFFLDTGDGVPRLVSAELIDPEFVPDPQDALFESGQLWAVTYLPYREIEELERDPNFYADYDGGASNADLRFVTDDEGDVLQLAVDIYDAFDEYLYTVEPQIGDQFNLGFKGYDLAEPDIFYIHYYFADTVAITDDMSLERRYYVPSAATDPELPDGFDSADLDLFLILEGVSEVNDEATFAYNTPTTLGYTWGMAQQPATTGQANSGGSGAIGLGALVMLLLGGCLRMRRRRI